MLPSFGAYVVMKIGMTSSVEKSRLSSAEKSSAKGQSSGKGQQKAAQKRSEQGNAEKEDRKDSAR